MSNEPTPTPIDMSDVVPYNEQKPNYQGNLSSGAKGKQRPIVNNEVTKESKNDN